MKKCIKCKTEYEGFMISNYNLGLCPKCFNKEETYIEREDMIDDVTHKITCPKCGKVYTNVGITDSKCKTKDCPVWFFWDDLDSVVIARWLK